MRRSNHASGCTFAVFMLFFCSSKFAFSVPITQDYVFQQQWPPLAQPWNFDKLQNIALAADGSLWITQQPINGHFELQHLKPDGSIIGQFGTTGQFSNSGIAVATDQKLWLTNSNGSVIQVNSNGNVENQFRNLSFVKGFLFVQTSNGIASVADGSFWVTNPTYGLALHFNKSGTLLSQVNSSCSALAFYLIDNGGVLGHRTPSASIDGSHWAWTFSNETNTNVLKHYDSDGRVLMEISETEIGGTGPIMVAKDGSLWLVYQGKNLRHLSSAGTLLATVENITPQIISQIKASPDGTLWLSYDNVLLHLDIQGSLLKQVVVSNVDYIYDIAVVSDQSIWLTTNAHLLQYDVKGGLLKQIDNFGQLPFGYLYTAQAADNSLWVSDGANKRVLHFSPQGDYLGNLNITSLDGIKIDSIGEVLINSNGNVLVSAISNNQSILLRYTNTGQFIEALDGDVYNTCAAHGPGSLAQPQGIGIAKDNSIWIADTGNNRIQHFSSSGQFIRAVGAPGNGPGQFQQPQNIALAQDGSLWVADSGNHRLQHFSAKGDYIGQVGSHGSTPGQFQTPTAIALASDGSLWVIDQGNGRIQHLNAQGVFISQIGRYFDDAKVENAFAEPAELSIAADGSLWIANAKHSSLTHLDADGHFLDQSGSYADHPNQLFVPQVTRAAADGSYWRVDSTHQGIERVNAQGKIINQISNLEYGKANSTIIPPPSISAIKRVENTQDGGVWVVDAWSQSFIRIMVHYFRPQHFSADGVLTAGCIFSRGVGTFSGYYLTQDFAVNLATDADGSLWFIDAPYYDYQYSSGCNLNSFPVKHIANDGSLVEQFGIIGSGPGQFNAIGSLLSFFVSDYAEIGKNNPLGGIAKTADGALWIADTGNNRIQKFVKRSTPVLPSVSYDAMLQTLNLHDVTLGMGTEHFDVVLASKNGHFVLNSAVQTSQRLFAPANFDPLSNQLTIPLASVNNTYYSGYLNHLGNYEFLLPANAVNPQSPSPLPEEISADQYLSIANVTVDQGKEHYAVTLVSQNGHYIVKSADLSAERPFYPANFDTKQNIVTVPLAYLNSYLGNQFGKYQGKLKHLGNYEFEVIGE